MIENMIGTEFKWLDESKLFLNLTRMIEGECYSNNTNRDYPILSLLTFITNADLERVYNLALKIGPSKVNKQLVEIIKQKRRELQIN